jgi:hypothetical protein
MRQEVMAALEIPQKEVDGLFSLVYDVLTRRDKLKTTCSEAFSEFRIAGNPVHDFLFNAFIIMESGCDPELTDVLLEAAQRKVEIEKTPAFQQTAQMIILRKITPYIQVQTSPERILDMQIALCSRDLPLRPYPC